jgi:TolB protein
MRTRALALLAIVAAGSLPAQTEIWTKITATPGAASLALVLAEISLPVRSDPEQQAAARTIHDVILADLAGSLFFQLRKPDSGRVLASDPAQVDFAGWGATGASVLVAGDLTPASMTLRVYDLISKRLIASKDYSRSGTDRALAHRIANEIIRLLTGEEGVATTRIVFSLVRGGGRELCTVDQDGLNLQQLTSSGGLKLSPNWSPDGTRIAYSTYYDNRLIVFGYDLSRGTASILCDHADMNDAPAWSPDGDRLAASLSDDDGQEIFIMDAAGRNRRRVTRNHGINTSPRWSPNGQQLAFVSDRAGSPQIYIINCDGTDQRRLTFVGDYNTTPAWSPRGDLIAYSRRDGGQNQLFITDLEGETSKQVTFSGDNVEPCFSPDGLHIAFISNRSGGRNIWVMNWDGTDQRQLTTVSGCSAPSWSPPPGR